MPDEEKKMVPIDTSGPEVDVNLPEEKETVVSEDKPEIVVEETTSCFSSWFSYGHGISML